MRTIKHLTARETASAHVIGVAPGKQKREANRLIALTNEHTEELYRLVERNRERLSVYLPWPHAIKSVQDTKNFVLGAMRLREEKISFVFAVVAADLRLAGVVSLDQASSPEPKIGYWIGGEWEGQGMIRHAVDRLCAKAFVDMRLDRVFIFCGTENTRSQATALRAGFSRIGIRRGAEVVCGRVIDHAVFCLCRNNFLAERARRPSGPDRKG